MTATSWQPTDEMAMELDLPTNSLISATDKAWFDANKGKALDNAPRFGTTETQQMASVDASNTSDNIVWKDWVITGSTTLLAAAAVATATALTF